jgi:SAM-dependent methyltransferase
VNQYDQYFEYLKGRSLLGAAYRRLYLYPRLSRHLAGRTLDIGCGLGDFLRSRPGSSGVDVNPRTVEFCRAQGLDARPMEPDVLPFEAASFDSVLLDNVLEHIAAPAPLLAEIRRVLRPRGRLLVGVPGRRGWQSDADHKVYYDEAGLAGTLARAGFEAEAIFHTPLWRSAWLSRRLAQYCVFLRCRRAESENSGGVE